MSAVAKSSKTNARARGTMLTKRVQNQITHRIRQGASIPTACKAVGMWSAAKNWLLKGQEGLQPYADFVAACERAKADWAAKAVERVTKSKDWRAAAWLLERRVKEFEPPRFRQELSGPSGGDITFAAAVVILPDDGSAPEKKA